MKIIVLSEGRKTNTYQIISEKNDVIGIIEWSKPRNSYVLDSCVSLKISEIEQIVLFMNLLLKDKKSLVGVENEIL